MTTDTAHPAVIERRMANINTELERRMASIQNRIDTALDAERDMTTDELANCSEDRARISTLETELATLRDAARYHVTEGRTADVMAELQRVTHGDPVHSGVPSLVHSDAEIRNVFDAIGNRQPVLVETRATVELAAVGGPIDRLRASVPEPRRISGAVGLTAERVPMRGASGAKYGLESVAAPTAEGDQKPEYDAITALNIVPQAFARWTDLTEQAVESMGGTADLLAAHARQIALDEDDYIIDALNTEAGAAIAFAADVQANVRGAIALVESTVAAPVDVIVVNPADFGLFAPTTPANGLDVGSRISTFGGALLYPSASQTAGIVVVAALRAVGKYVTATGLRTAVLPDLKTNILTVRSELFSGFGVKIAGGVVAVDVAA